MLDVQIFWLQLCQLWMHSRLVYRSNSMQCSLLLKYSPAGWDLTFLEVVGRCVSFLTANSRLIFNIITADFFSYVHPIDELSRKKPWKKTIKGYDIIHHVHRWHWWSSLEPLKLVRGSPGTPMMQHFPVAYRLLRR